MRTKQAAGATQCAYLRTVIRRLKDKSVVASLRGNDLCLSTPAGRCIAELFVHRGEVHRVGGGLVPERAIATDAARGKRGNAVPKEETKLYVSRLKTFDGKQRRIRGIQFEWRFRGTGFAVKNNEVQDMEEESFRLMEELDALMRKRAKLGPRPEFAFRELTRQWERDPKGAAERVIKEFAGTWRLVNGEFVSRKNGITVVLVPERGTVSVQQHKNGVYDIVTLVETAARGVSKGSVSLWMRGYGEKLRVATGMNA